MVAVGSRVGAIAGTFLAVLEAGSPSGVRARITSAAGDRESIQVALPTLRVLRTPGIARQSGVAQPDKGAITVRDDRDSTVVDPGGRSRLPSQPHVKITREGGSTTTYSPERDLAGRHGHSV